MGVKKQHKTGKKKRSNQKTSKRYSMYKTDGKKVEGARFCPRCGPGFFLAKNKDRAYCGKCHYTEFFAKTENGK